MLNKYRLDLKYLGTDFSGWQSQANGQAVQDYIEKALRQILSEPALRLSSASRTDAGVHAHKQVAAFSSEKTIDTYRLQASLQALLPKSIGVESVSQTAADFSPQKSAKAKAYRYLYWLHPLRDPFVEGFSWMQPSSLNLEQMEAASKALLGKHDFTAFCAADSTAATKTRTVFDIRFRRNGHLVEFWILGDGFLKQMIRAMAGTLALAGNGQLDDQGIRQILAAKDRTKAGPTAPACGLCLMHIFYGDEQPSLDFLMQRFWGIII